MSIKTDLELQDQWLLPPEDDEDDDADELYYFYDHDDNYYSLRHERGDMPGTDHSDLEDYLMQLLIWLYRVEGFGIYRELNFYQTDDPMEKPVYPDLALLKSQKRTRHISYRLGKDGPPPELVIEIISRKTRKNDLVSKPKIYERWGVKEYFTYDPRQFKRKLKASRLTGWRWVDGSFKPIEADKNGWLWSEQLDSWLAPDGFMLRLYDKDKNRRLTEAETYAREVLTHNQEAEAYKLEAERQRQAKEEALQREMVLRQELQQMVERLRQFEKGQDKT